MSFFNSRRSTLSPYQNLKYKTQPNRFEHCTDSCTLYELEIPLKSYRIWPLWILILYAQHINMYVLSNKKKWDQVLFDLSDNHVNWWGGIHSISVIQAPLVSEFNSWKTKIRGLNSWTERHWCGQPWEHWVLDNRLKSPTLINALWGNYKVDF